MIQLRRYLSIGLFLTALLTKTVNAQAAPQLQPQPQPQPQPTEDTKNQQAIAQKKPTEYVRHVVCDYATGTCDQGLVISGTFSSSIEVIGITRKPTVRVTADAHERNGRYDTWVPQDSSTGSVQITVYKSRRFFPAYNTTASKKTFLQGITPGEPVLKEREIVMNGESDTLSLLVDKKNFTISVEWSPWSVETGGFYAYTWARDQIIVSQAVKNPDPAVGPQTRIIATRSGDRLGPVTGITFVFHPGNYPNFGFEFGQATNGTRPNSYYLGVGARLLHHGDLALLTLSTGISHVSVTTYPGILPDHTYATDDPLLNGRSRYTNRKYVALGLGINFSGSSATASSQTH